MSNILGLDLKVDQEYLKNAVQEVVKASMVEALDSKESIIQEAIIKIINTKVRPRDGEIDTRNYSDSISFVEYTLQQAIVEITKITIIEEIETKKEMLAEMIKKEMNKKATLNKFVESFITNTTQTLENSYRTRIDIKFDSKED